LLRDPFGAARVHTMGDLVGCRPPAPFGWGSRTETRDV
jgi:hypothetical protein